MAEHLEYMGGTLNRVNEVEELQERGRQVEDVMLHENQGRQTLVSFHPPRLSA